jgi:hypothetical protein
VIPGRGGLHRVQRLSLPRPTSTNPWGTLISKVATQPKHHAYVIALLQPT